MNLKRIFTWVACIAAGVVWIAKGDAGSASAYIAASFVILAMPE